MKLLDKTPKPVIRIQIDDRENSTSSGITLEDTTIEEALEYAKDVANKTPQTLKACVVSSQLRIRVSVFKAVSQSRSGAKSFTIYNITPVEFKESLIKNMKSNG